MVKTAIEEATDGLRDVKTRRQELFTAVGEYLDEGNRNNRLSSKIAERKMILTEHIDEYNKLLVKEFEIINQAQKILSLEKAHAEKKAAADKLGVGPVKTAAEARLKEIAADITSSEKALNDMILQYNLIGKVVDEKYNTYGEYIKLNAHFYIESNTSNIIGKYADISGSIYGLDELIANLNEEEKPDNRDQIFEIKYDIEEAIRVTGISTEPIGDFATLRDRFNTGLAAYYINRNVPKFQGDYDASLQTIIGLFHQVRAITNEVRNKASADEKIAECDKLDKKLVTEIEKAITDANGRKQDANKLNKYLEDGLKRITAAEDRLKADIEAAEARAQKRASPGTFFITAIVSVLALVGVVQLRISDLGLYYALFMVLPVILAFLAVVQIILLNLVRRGHFGSIRFFVLHSFSYVLLPLCVLALFSIVISESDVLSIALSAAGLSVIVFKMVLFCFGKPVATSYSALKSIYKFDRRWGEWTQNLLLSAVSLLLGYNVVQSEEWMTIFPQEYLSAAAILLSAIAVIETRNINRDAVRSSKWIAFFVIVLGAIIHYTVQTSLILRAPDVMDIRMKLARYAV